MELLEIKHYVEDSFNNSPSYIMKMSDDNDYISNNYHFCELTEDKIAWFIKVYDCEKEMNKLFQSPSISTNELVNGSYMFDGCKNLSSVEYFPILEDGFRMFRKCKNIINVGDFPSLRDGNRMFYGCENLSNIGNFPSLKNGMYMFDGCENLINVTNFPILVDGHNMFTRCVNLVSVGIFPSLKDGFRMFDGCKSLTDVDNNLLTRNDFYMFNGCDKLNGKPNNNVIGESLHEIAHQIFSSSPNWTIVESNVEEYEIVTKDCGESELWQFEEDELDGVFDLSILGDDDVKAIELI